MRRLLERIFSDLPIPVLSVKSHTELLLSSAALFPGKNREHKNTAFCPIAGRAALRFDRKKFRPGGAIAAPVPLPGKKVP